MKKRIFIGVSVLVALLTVVGLLTAQAKASPKVTGDVGFESWGMEIDLTFSVKESNPAASVKVTAKAGSDYLEYVPICVTFTKDGTGLPIAVMVLKVTQTTRTDVGTGLIGEYGIWMVRDGGTPGTNGDQWTVQSYQDPPKEWIEYWPANEEPPGCEDFNPSLDSNWAQDVVEGNLVIHNK